MEYLMQLSQFIMDNQTYVIPGLSSFLVIVLIILLSVLFQIGSLNRRYKRLMQGMDGVNIEGMMVGHIDEVRSVMVKLERLSTEACRLDTVLQTCTQRVALVRFNAFEDTGSDLSFSLAMLDAHNNGIILSSIYGRNESRIYAKPVLNGQSSYFLTTEEKEALTKAQENNSK